MQSNINPNASHQNSVAIRDIVVPAKLGPDGKARGEYGFSPETTQKENPTRLINRLFSKIKGIVSEAAKVHKQENCIWENKLRAGRENNITRVITNEFFFYTREPLTLEQFQTLQQKILYLAADQPENLHLILGSFAVKTPDGKVANIVPHVECGPNSKFNFIVKNYPSDIDPVYDELNASDILVRLPDACIISDNLSNIGINLNGKMHNFSYDNIIECKTKSGNTFNSCVDICLDHGFGVAKNNLTRKLKTALYATAFSLNSNNPPAKIPTLLSHVVVSNSVNLIPENSLGYVTHADPRHSYYACKTEGPLSTFESAAPALFGISARETMIKTAIRTCDSLPPKQLALVEAHLAMEKFIAKFKGSTEKRFSLLLSQLHSLGQLEKADVTSIMFNAANNHNMALLQALKNSTYLDQTNLEYIAIALKNPFSIEASDAPPPDFFGREARDAPPPLSATEASDAPPPAEGISSSRAATRHPDPAAYVETLIDLREDGDINDNYIKNRYLDAYEKQDIFLLDAMADNKLLAPRTIIELKQEDKMSDDGFKKIIMKALNEKDNDRIDAALIITKLSNPGQLKEWVNKENDTLKNRFVSGASDAPPPYRSGTGSSDAPPPDFFAREARDAPPPLSATEASDAPPPAVAISSNTAAIRHPDPGSYAKSLFELRHDGSGDISDEYIKQRYLDGYKNQDSPLLEAMVKIRLLTRKTVIELREDGDMSDDIFKKIVMKAWKDNDNERLNALTLIGLLDTDQLVEWVTKERDAMKHRFVTEASDAPPPYHVAIGASDTPPPAEPTSSSDNIPLSIDDIDIGNFFEDINKQDIRDDWANNKNPAETPRSKVDTDYSKLSVNEIIKLRIAEKISDKSFENIVQQAGKDKDRYFLMALAEKKLVTPAQMEKLGFKEEGVKNTSVATRSASSSAQIKLMLPQAEPNKLKSAITAPSAATGKLEVISESPNVAAPSKSKAERIETEKEIAPEQPERIRPRNR